MLQHDHEGSRPPEPVYGQPGVPVTVGGPSGDYFIPADIPDSRWVEYQILAVAQVGNGTANVVVNPRSAPKAPDYTGATTYNKDTRFYGEVYVAGANITNYPQTDWRRITSSEKGLYARIDTTTGACFLTVRFRSCIHEIIPGPSVTVHPDHMHQMNIDRSRRIEEHIKQVGIPNYARQGSTDRD